MDDLIRRQAAIDAIQQHRENVLGSYEYDEGVAFVYAAAHNHIIDVIKRLQSAQPEIIRCGQCKYAEVADKEDAQDGYTCQFHRGSIWFSGSYCSWAERRTDG